MDSATFFSQLRASNPMKISLLVLSLLLLASSSPLRADSGGPYLGVPDAAASERGPVFQIPRTEQPLRHYLKHLPSLVWNKEIGEPETYSWQALTGYHASLSSLGHVGGHEILCVRYTPDKRIEQGLAYADTILILARNHDTSPASTLCVPIFYASGGEGVYDYTTSVLDMNGAPILQITAHLEGTGGMREEIMLRYMDGKFGRVDEKGTKK